MLKPLDLIIIVVYLLITIAAGILFGGKQKDTGDYFTAGASSPVSLTPFLWA